VRDGAELVIDGQKIWSSRAQYSDYGMLIGRSDPSAPKHAGLSAVIVDMRAPGIDVRPIRQIDGGDSFAEVFFTGVRLPADSLLGEWNDGWAVARRTLMNERFALASRGRDAGLTQLRQMAEAAGLADDKVIRHRLTDIHIKVQLLRYLGLRLESAARRQLAPGPEGSVAKLLYGEVLDTAAALGMELLGPWGMTSTLSGPDDLGRVGSEADDAEPYGLWQAQLLGAPSAHIAGGTDQILRNVIGERMLGLPREPRAAGQH
jgi:alkylation response protein AidB-like acyl-CoA dehydrogenase